MHDIASSLTYEEKLELFSILSHYVNPKEIEQTKVYVPNLNKIDEHKKDDVL
jgi:hypothetical protein